MFNSAERAQLSWAWKKFYNLGAWNRRMQYLIKLYCFSFIYKYLDTSSGSQMELVQILGLVW